MRLSAAAAFVAFVLVGCDSGATEPPGPPPTAIHTESSSGGEAHPFDRLTIELQLDSATVASGKGVASRLVVRNESGRPVTDPGCQLYAPSYGLIPVDDPDAELWSQVVVDCSGPFTFKPGYVDRSVGPTFRATNKFGDSLPPGEYFAAMELEDLSEQLLVPVEVTD